MNIKRRSFNKLILGGAASLAAPYSFVRAQTADPKPGDELVVGIWGGAMVAVDWLGVYEGSFWSNMQNSVSFYDDVLNGVIKSIVFAFVVTWIAVFQGYDCEPTSEGISRATTRTVVYASLAVLGLDFILTALMFGDF